jgi:hypothetical protein
VNQTPVNRHREPVKRSDLIRIHDAIERLQKRLQQELASKPDGKPTSPIGGLLGADKPAGSAEVLAGSNSSSPSLKGANGGLGISQGAVTPSRYRDTYGGDRVNGAHGVDAKNFGGGGGSGHFSDDPDGQEKEPQKTSYDQMTDAQRNVWQEVLDTFQANTGNQRFVMTGNMEDDITEATYAMKVGEAIYGETSDMTWGERGVYFENMAIEQRTGGEAHNRSELTALVKKLNGGYDDPTKDPSGTYFIFGTPRMKAAQLRFAARAITAAKRKAGGGVDPRLQQQGGNGGGLNLVDKSDRQLARVESGGPIDWDRVLFINATVNPSRR